MINKIKEGLKKVLADINDPFNRKITPPDYFSKYKKSICMADDRDCSSDDFNLEEPGYSWDDFNLEELNTTHPYENGGAITLYKYEYSILELCEKLHMQKSGASDPMSDLELDASISALKDRINNWSDPSSSYDLAVKNLIISVLAEYKAI